MTYTSPERMLRQFHATLNVHGGLAPDTPTAVIPGWVRDLRLKLLDEEVAELREAMMAGDIVKIADGLADIAYVIAGTAVPYGIPFDAVFAEVHRSNMTKTNAPDLGKLVKGPGYQPPRIAEILSGCPAVTSVPGEESEAVVMACGPDKGDRFAYRCCSCGMESGDIEDFNMSTCWECCERASWGDLCQQERHEEEECADGDPDSAEFCPCPCHDRGDRSSIRPAEAARKATAGATPGRRACLR